MREFMDKIAPLNNVDQDHEAAVRRAGQERPARAAERGRADGRRRCKKRDTPVWYLMAKDEGHGFAKKKNADFQFYATVVFMQEYLLKVSLLSPAFRRKEEVSFSNQPFRTPSA